ncbi:MAG: helix-turn-helix domain-containing protein [Pseudomonadota bacterium]
MDVVFSVAASLLIMAAIYLTSLKTANAAHFWFASALLIQASSYVLIVWAAEANQTWMLGFRPYLAGILPTAVVFHVVSGWTNDALQGRLVRNYSLLQATNLLIIAFSRWQAPILTDLILFLVWSGHAFWLLAYTPRQTSSLLSGRRQMFWKHWRRVLALWMSLSAIIDAFSAYEIAIYSTDARASNILGMAGVFSIVIFGIGLILVFNLDRLHRRFFKSRIENDQDLRHLFERLERDMKSQALYLNPNLTISRLARHVKLPTRSVSSAINAIAGENFNRWVNKFRVEEAKSLMSRKPNQNLLNICLDAGFQSKSTFNAAFKEETGLTPSQWRKMSVRELEKLNTHKSSR